VRLLLDTQIALWWLVANPRLSRAARKGLTEGACAVSVASIWEVAIKHALGKLPVAPRDFRDELAAAGVAILSIADSHALATSDLPPGHKDPFDRLLLATAQCEGMQLVTADAALLRYAADYPGLPVRQI